MKTIFLIFSAIFGQDCFGGKKSQEFGVIYSGKVDKTVDGIRCQRWDSNSPHTPKFMPYDGGHHNYCRNPDKDPHGVWCYTTDPKRKIGYCDESDDETGSATEITVTGNPCSTDPCGRMNCIKITALTYKCECPTFLPNFRYDYQKRQCGKILTKF